MILSDFQDAGKLLLIQASKSGDSLHDMHHFQFLQKTDLEISVPLAGDEPCA